MFRLGEGRPAPAGVVLPMNLVYLPTGDVGGHAIHTAHHDTLSFSRGDVPVDPDASPLLYGGLPFQSDASRALVICSAQKMNI